MALKNLCDMGIVDPYPPLCDVRPLTAPMMPTTDATLVQAYYGSFLWLRPPYERLEGVAFAWGGWRGAALTWRPGGAGDRELRGAVGAHHIPPPHLQRGDFPRGGLLGETRLTPGKVFPGTRCPSAWRWGESSYCLGRQQQRNCAAGRLGVGEWTNGAAAL